MSIRLKRLLAFFVLTLMPGFAPAMASGVSVQLPPSVDIDTSLLTGDVRLACEALLCLSGSSRPSECGASLSHFFGIKKKKLSDTLDARQAFLALCPVVRESSAMQGLAKALAHGAGQCDAKTLNRTLAYTYGQGGDAGYDRTVISDKLPSYCSAYILHEYTDLRGDMPRYVGTPEEDGFWAEAKDYDRALAKYQRDQAAKKAARENYGGGY